MGAQETEIENLIQGCKAGERKAQYALYKYFYEFTMRIAMRYSRDDTDAADILSHAFLRVFKSINNYDSSKGNFYGWIKRIVINEGIDHIRSRKVIEHEDIEEVVDLSVDNAIIENIDVAEVMLQVKKLPPATHAVFIMYAIDGYTHKEIAEQLNISEGTSKWHLSEARKLLQKTTLRR